MAAVAMELTAAAAVVVPLELAMTARAVGLAGPTVVEAAETPEALVVLR